MLNFTVPALVATKCPGTLWAALGEIKLSYLAVEFQSRTLHSFTGRLFIRGGTFT